MDFLVSAIAFLIIFSVIILIHEFGHFYVAKKSGIKVEEFGLGLPPRIWGKKYKGTIYSFNWIPFGGFVRMYGEDATNPKELKSKDSFASKPIINRMAVVLAGVFMNFFLAIFLLTVGFSFGIQPLILSSQDLFNAIDSKVIEIQPEIIIKDVEKDSSASKAGLLGGDIILAVNDDSINDLKQLAVLSQPLGEKDIKIKYLRNGIVNDATVEGIKEGSMDGSKVGINLYETITFLPTVYIKDIKEGSDTQAAGLMPGDVIYKINGKQVFSVENYSELISKDTNIKYEVIRNHQILNFDVNFSNKQETVINNREVLIAGIENDTPAFKAGFKEGDIIVDINGTGINSPDDAVNQTKNNIGNELLYKINRSGNNIELKVVPAENGRIGVSLISMVTYSNNQLSLYNSDYITSVIKVNDVKYPFFQAIGQAFNETGRLSIITVEMFGNVVRSIVSQFAIPEGVAGPVGIARMTHVFTQQGLLALLRFTALLSLSLAVINILPFPALDGGRFIFLLIEAICRKRVPAKWEAAIHTVGFLLLIGLIFLVTYSDILNIFL
jgi:regulator of sigma E protease